MYVQRKLEHMDRKTVFMKKEAHISNGTKYVHIGYMNLK